jgi:hypothetical protein
MDKTMHSDLLSPAEDRWIPQADVCRRYSCSVMALWRRERHPTLGFPKSILINRRRYWKLSELLRFEVECATRSCHHDREAAA